MFHNIFDPIGKLKNEFLYEFSIIGYKYSFEGNGKHLVTKLDDYVKRDINCFHYLFKCLIRDHPSGGLILGTGEFGNLFKDFSIKDKNYNIEDFEDLIMGYFPIINDLIQI